MAVPHTDQDQGREGTVNILPVRPGNQPREGNDLGLLRTPTARTITSIWQAPSPITFLIGLLLIMLPIQVSAFPDRTNCAWGWRWTSRIKYHMCLAAEILRMQEMVTAALCIIVKAWK